MIMFLVQITLCILGIIGFFTPVTSFMIIALVGLILCDIIGIVAGTLNSLNTDFFYLFVAIILCFFIDRKFWEVLSVTFSICGAIESILGVLLMAFTGFLFHNRKKNYHNEEVNSDISDNSSQQTIS